MALTLADYLIPIHDRLCPRVISVDSFAALRKFSSTIPGQVTAFFGFECPMHASCSDLLFCSTQEEGHAAILAGQHETIELSDYVVQSDSWQTVKRFCIDWQSQSSSLHGQLRNIWLEFDIGQGVEPYQPSLFFGIPQHMRDDSAGVSQTIISALGMLDPLSVQLQRGHMLRRVLTQLPGSSYVFQVGVMLSRQVPAIRVCIRDISPGDIVPALECWGWSSCSNELLDVIDRYRNCCERMDLDIDVGTVVGPKIGLECYFGQSQKTFIFMRNFMDHLIEQGLASDDKCQAIIEYNGLVHQDECPEHWHDQLLRMAVLQGANVINHMSCWLHHIKLVSVSGSPLTAKAYLGALLDRTDRNELRRALAAFDSNDIG